MVGGSSHPSGPSRRTCSTRKIPTGDARARPSRGSCAAPDATGASFRAHETKRGARTRRARGRVRTNARAAARWFYSRVDERARVRLAVGTFPRLRLWRGGGEAGTTSARFGRAEKKSRCCDISMLLREARSERISRMPPCRERKKSDGPRSAGAKTYRRQRQCFARTRRARWRSTSRLPGA